MSGRATTLRWSGVIVATALATTAAAADRTWSGSAAFPGFWSTAVNWAGGVAPADGDSVTFAASDYLAANQNVGNPFRFETLRFTSQAPSFSLTGSPFQLMPVNSVTPKIDMDAHGPVTIQNTITQVAWHPSPSSSVATPTHITGTGTGTLTLNGAFSNTSISNQALFVLPVGNGAFTVVLANANNAITEADIRGAATLRLGVGTGVPAGTRVVIRDTATFDLATFSNTAATAIARLELHDDARLLVGSGHSGHYHLDWVSINRVGITDLGLSNGITLHVSHADGIRAFPGSSTATIALANGGRVVNDWTGPTTIEVSPFGAPPANGINLDVSARLSSAGTHPEFVKTGAGVLRLISTGNTADLTVQEGKLRVDTLPALGSGALKLDGGALFYNGPTAVLTKAIPMTANGGTVEVGLAGTTLTVAGAVSGTGGQLTKTGAGKLVLSSTPTYTGGTVVEAGTLQLGAAPGAAVAPLTVSGGAYDLNGYSQTVAKLTLGADGTLKLGGGTMTVTASGTLAGPVTGPGTFAVNAGTQTFGAPQLFVAVPVQINGGGLTLQGHSQTFASLTGAAGTTINLGSAALTVGGDNSSTAHAGTISGLGGALVKKGTGTFTLSGANSYGGGTTVEAGTLSIPADGALGAAGAPVTAGPGGKVLVTGSTATARTFTLTGGALEAASGATLQYQSGAAVNGGFLRGAGTHQLLAGSSVTGATALNGSTVNQTGAAALANFTNSGKFTSSAALTWDGGYNSAAGTLTVNGTANVKFFESVGALLIPSGGALMNGDSDLALGGTTFIGSAAAPGGKIDLGGKNLKLLNGLLVNNGGGFAGGGGVRNGTTVVDYGGLAKGDGYYDAIETQNGGVYSPGNSPGTGHVGDLTLAPGARYAFEIRDAAGAAGVDWDLTRISLRFSVTATPERPADIALRTLLTGDAAGPMANFDPARPYTWTAFTLEGVATADGFDPAALRFDTTGLANPAEGTFALVRDGQAFAIQYSPVPEPATLALTGLGLAAVLWRRRRRIAAVVAMSALVLASPATAAERTWSSSAAFPGFWSTTANWAGGVAPAHGDTATFGASPYLSPHNNLSPSPALHTLRFTAAAGNYTLGGNPIVFNGNHVSNNNGRIDVDANSSVTVQNAIEIQKGGLFDNVPNLVVLGSGSGTLTLGGPITHTEGDPSLSIFPTGGDLTVVLAAAGNTYSGGTFVQGGTLRLAIGTALPAGKPVEVNYGATLDLATVGNTSLSAVGAVTVDGQLRVGSGNTAAFHLKSLTMERGTVTDLGLSNGFDLRIKDVVGIKTFANASPSTITLANGGRLLNDAAGPLTVQVAAIGTAGAIDLDIGAALSSAGTNPSFVKTGAGVLRLTNAANTANLSVTAGTLRIDNVAALGSGAVSLDNATLFYNGPTATTAKALTLGPNAVPIDVGQAGTTLTLSTAPTFSGGIGLAKAGPGALAFTAPISHTGTTAVQAGTLRLGVNSALPNRPVNVAAGATFDVNGFSQTFTEPFTLNGSLALGGGQLNVSGLTGAASSTITLGGGTLTLNAASSHAGTTTGAGQLTAQATFDLNAANALSPLARLQIGAAGTVKLNGHDQAVGSLTGTGAVVLGSAALTVGGDNTAHTFGGSLQGTGSLVKVGTGTLTLTGTNAHTGGTTVSGGALVFAADGNLGGPAAPVSVGAAGKLLVTASTATGRSFTLNGGALEAAGGATVQYQSGAAVHGGFLRGSGTHQILAGSAMYGATALNGTSIAQVGAATVGNFTNAGAFSSNAALTWDGGFNTAAGWFTVNSTANVKFFESTGVIGIPAGGVLQNSHSPLVLGGGSTTFIGAADAPGGKIDLSGFELRLRGGLLSNNGGNFASGGGVRNGTTIVDYGGLAKGNGFYDAIETKNGGVYSPGNSPGLGQVGTFNVSGGGTYTFEINDATGTAGPVLPATRGWDKTEVFTAMNFTATPANKFNVVVKTLLPPSGDTPGAMDNFNPAQGYTWPTFELMGGATQSGTFNSAAFNINTAQFVGPATGSFAMVQMGNVIALQYTPVPEPVTTLLVCLGGVGAAHAWRRRGKTSTAREVVR